jgi:hypothetical protein
VGLSHFTGPEPGPDLDAIASLRASVTVDSDGFLNIKARDARLSLRQAHDIIHVTGADVATTLGDVAARAEVALIQNRPFPRVASDLISPAAIREIPLAPLVPPLSNGERVRVPIDELFPNRDAIEWGLGADRTFAGIFTLVQVTEVVLLERAPRLLIGDPETRLLASLRRSLLQDRLELELRGVYAVERGGWFSFARASWQLRDDLRLRVGYLAVGGPRQSLFGEFGRNDEVVFQVRQAF